MKALVCNLKSFSHAESTIRDRWIQAIQEERVTHPLNVFPSIIITHLSKSQAYFTCELKQRPDVPYTSLWASYSSNEMLSFAEGNCLFHVSVSECAIYCNFVILPDFDFSTGRP